MLAYRLMNGPGNLLISLLARTAVHIRSGGRSWLPADWVARNARRALVAAGDPLVSFELGGVRLELPLSHDLPYHLAAFPQYGANLGRLAAAVWRAHPDRSVVDIGANVGDTAAVIRASSPAPVLCIEGDPRFFAVLQRNASRIPGPVLLEQALVGATAGVRVGRLSSAHGTGRVVDEPGELRFERLETILARHPELPPPGLLKSDTDGFDCAIIEGHLQLWARLRPVLFVEYDPAFLAPDFDATSFFGGLAGAGYDRVVVWENTGDLADTLSCTETVAIRALHRRYTGFESRRYADVAAFHRDDDALAREVIAGERSQAP